jgi:hypothetical protein
MTRFWGRIVILAFANISREFPSNPWLFPENEEISAPPLCGVLIGIYKFYKSWATETFRQNLERRGR